MYQLIIRSLTVAALVAYPAFALGADQVPDVKGKWIGKTHTILVGKGGHWPNGRGTWDKPALLEKDPVIDITGQDGRRFWGVTTISGGGEKTDEPFIGELTGKDNRNFVFADTDGFWQGQLDGGDTLSFCYRHTGSSSTIVSCTEVKRTRKEVAAFQLTQWHSISVGGEPVEDRVRGSLQCGTSIRLKSPSGHQFGSIVYQTTVYQTTVYQTTGLEEIMIWIPARATQSEEERSPPVRCGNRRI